MQFLVIGYIIIKDINTIANITDNTDKLGLHLNAAKCEVVYGGIQATHDDDTLKNFQRVKLEDLTLLGAPVLSGCTVDIALKEKRVKMEKAMPRLPLLQSHNVLNLFHNSIAVPKLLYTMRTSNCRENEMLTYFDTLQRQCITDIIKVDINELQWTQATLNVRDGGLGIRSVTMLAPSAFLESATGTLQIQYDNLPQRLHDVIDCSIVKAIRSWKAKSNYPFKDSNYTTNKKS